MTLLTISENVFDEVQIARLSSIVGNTAADAQRLLRYVNKVGSRLMEKYDWQILRKEQTFSALNQETQTSILPAEFDRFVPETFWNRNVPELYTGPVPSVQWQALKASTYQGYPTFFAYRGGEVLIIPSPTAGETLAFEYMSKYWAQSSGGAGQATMQADTDVGVLDEELIAAGVILQWLISEGQPAGGALQDFEEKLNMLADNEYASDGILTAGDIFGTGGRRFTGEPPGDGINNLLVV